MPDKGKRKDNPGKMDRVNPPLKTRLPVTGHPQPPSLSPVEPPPPTLPKQRFRLEHVCQLSTDLLAIVPFPEYEDSLYSTPSNKWKYLVFQLTELLAQQNKVTHNVPDDIRQGSLSNVSSISTDTEDNGRTEREWQKLEEDRTFLIDMIEESRTTAPTTPGTDTSTQTILPDSVSANTDTPPVRTYAEAATSTTSLPSGAGKGKGKEERKTQTPPPTHYKPSAPRKITTRDRVPQHAGFITTPPPNRSRAIVFHAAPMKYKPGLMRRWIEEDNEGARIVGIRWLLQEGRRVGKLASSLVIYLAAEIDTTHGLRMGKRVFRTTNYEWNRGL